MRYTECLAIAPSRCNSLISTIAYDVNEHAANLHSWKQRYDQISSGRFYGSFTKITFDGLKLFYEHTNQQLQRDYRIPSDCIWLSIAANPGFDTRVDGMSVGDNELICWSGGGEFELITPYKYHAYGLVINKELLNKMANLEGVQLATDVLSGYSRFSIPAALMNNLRTVLNRMLRQATVIPGSKHQQDLVIMALIEVLKSQQPCDKQSPSYKHRKQVVDRVRNYLIAHRESAVSIGELCDSVGTCRRTLQYSFESIVGLSPIKYMRAIRLNGVRRSLLVKENKPSVAEAAAQWGFLHLSQFAKDYRELFGECPSDT